jgi:hypothetical protein
MVETGRILLFSVFLRLFSFFICYLSLDISVETLPIREEFSP